MTATKGFVVPAGGGKHLDMAAPGRFAALKLLGHETNESIMLFEETVPVGTKSLLHLHRDSDEVSRRPKPALRTAPLHLVSAQRGEIIRAWTRSPTPDHARPAQGG